MRTSNDGEMSAFHMLGLPDPVSGLSVDSMRGSEGHIQAFRNHPDSDGNDPPGVFQESQTDPRTGDPYYESTPGRVAERRLAESLKPPPAYHRRETVPQQASDQPNVTTRQVEPQSGVVGESGTIEPSSPAPANVPPGMLDRRGDSAVPPEDDRQGGAG